MQLVENITDPRLLRKNLATGLRLAMIFVSGYMVYRLLGVIANSASPAVVVLSGSMEPAFQRGDILLLWNTEKLAKVGDVVVYDTKRHVIPIVHRVVNEHHNSLKQLLLTKGDNNALNDLNLYSNNAQYLNRELDVTSGIVKAYVPLVGYVTILMAESPLFKKVFLGGALLLTWLAE